MEVEGRGVLEADFNALGGGVRGVLLREVSYMGVGGCGCVLGDSEGFFKLKKNFKSIFFFKGK